MISPKSDWSFRFLRWYCHPAFEEDISGDLEEMFRERESERGTHLARWLLFRDVLVLLALLGIALLTISFKVVQTAKANPVDSLKYE